MTRTLFLERPAFWTDVRDPESWLRALEAVDRASASALTGSPRAVWERALQSVLSRRAALGLFGPIEVPGGALLHGLGLLRVGEGGTWGVSQEASALLSSWRSSREEGLAELAGLVVRESAWVRLLLQRLLSTDWVLADWPRVRAGHRGLTPGESLTLIRAVDPRDWFRGVERRVAACWLDSTSCSDLAIAPEVLGRDPRRDDLSLAPLTAPLHLLEAVGWLDAQGGLRLPTWAHGELVDRPSPADLLTDLTTRRADVRGFVPVEPVLRELHAVLGETPLDDAAFARWMDELLEPACATGALEVLAAEPGQARHGRGLFGDPARQLVRWVVHPDFDAHVARHQARIASSPVSGDAP